VRRNRHHNKRYEDRAWPEAYATNGIDEWMVKKAETNKQGCMNKHKFILSILSDYRSSLRHINANQHLSTGLLRRSQLLEFTEIIRDNAVCFYRAIQRWILSLPTYIMNSCYYRTGIMEAANGTNVAVTVLTIGTQRDLSANYIIHALHRVNRRRYTRCLSIWPRSQLASDVGA